MHRSSRPCLMGSAALGGALAISLGVHAQAQAPAAGDPQVSEVVVTAEKRTERLRDVAASVSVVSGRSLEQMQATQLQDWAGYVPGFTVAEAGAPGRSFIALDGIAPIGAASEVGLYVDETPIGSSGSFAGANGFSMDLLPYDLDRAEVLRGPQGTLYGASTMGGLVKYVLAAPDLGSFSGRVGGDVFGIAHAGAPGGGGRAEVNIPLMTDKLAVRVSGYYESTPGYIDNATTGAKGDNALDQEGGRIALLWRPTSDLSVRLGAIYQNSHADNQPFVALSTLDGRPLNGPLSNINTLPEPSTQALQLYDLTLNWDQPWAKLTSITSYQSFANQTIQDLTDYIGVYLGLFGAPGPGLSDFHEDYRLKKFTQEVRLASPQNKRLEWMVGAFYTHESSSNYEVINAFDASGAPLPGLNPLELLTLPSTYQEYAFFANATVHVTDGFDVGAGVRYAHNNQTFTETESGVLVGAPVVVPGSSSEGVATFSVNPRLHLSKDAIAYARIASGYQPGGPNIVPPGSTGVPAQFGSSRLIDYQIGLKSSFLDGRASLDLSAFDIDWSKIQVSVMIGNTSGIENAGAARSQGVDLAGTLSPIAGLSLGASLAYTDATLTQPVPSIGAASGARLPYVPMWAGSLSADYTHALSARWTGFVGAGFRYTGSRYSDVQGSVANGEPQGLEVKRYGVLDLHVGARGEGLTIRVFAKNLLDKRAYLAPANYFYSALGEPIDIPAPVLQPRTVGLSIDKSF